MSNLDEGEGDEGEMIRVSMLMMFEIYYCKEQKISVRMMLNGP